MENVIVSKSCSNNLREEYVECNVCITDITGLNYHVRNRVIN